jgi:hypothetical protein
MTLLNTRPKRSPSKPGRVSLNLDEINNLVEDQGILVKVTPALLCPAITDLESYNHDLDCTLCDNQIIDLDAQSYTSWAVVQGIHHDKRFEADGVLDLKDVQITLKSNSRINYWYKIEVLDFTSTYNQLVKRSSTGDFDRTRYQPIEASMTPFHLVGRDGIYYVKGVDYTVGVHGIDWISINRPAAGSIFSFVYPILPVFRVLEHLHESRYYYKDFKSPEKTPIHFPQQVHARWDYVARGSGYEETAPLTPAGPVSPPSFKPGFGGDE